MVVVNGEIVDTVGMSYLVEGGNAKNHMLIVYYYRLPKLKIISGVVINTTLVY
jgi:hypothetical protein